MLGFNIVRPVTPRSSLQTKMRPRGRFALFLFLALYFSVIQVALSDVSDSTKSTDELILEMEQLLGDDNPIDKSSNQAEKPVEKIIPKKAPSSAKPATPGNETIHSHFSLNWW